MSEGWNMGVENYGIRLGKLHEKAENGYKPCKGQDRATHRPVNGSEKKHRAVFLVSVSCLSRPWVHQQGSQGVGDRTMGGGRGSRCHEHRKYTRLHNYPHPDSPSPAPSPSRRASAFFSPSGPLPLRYTRSSLGSKPPLPQLAHSGVGSPTYSSGPNSRCSFSSVKKRS